MTSAVSVSLSICGGRMVASSHRGKVLGFVASPACLAEPVGSHTGIGREEENTASSLHLAWPWKEEAWLHFSQNHMHLNVNPGAGGESQRLIGNEGVSVFSCFYLS